MRLYLDTCTFNRPFDDHTHVKVFLEAQAKLTIQERVKKGEYELVWSYMLFVHIGIKAKDALHIASAIDGQSVYFITTDNRILGVADRIPEIKIISPLGFIEKEDQP